MVDCGPAICSRLRPASVFMKLVALFTVHFTTSSTKKLLWTTVRLAWLLEPHHPMSGSYGKIARYPVIRLCHNVHTQERSNRGWAGKGNLISVISFFFFSLCSLNKYPFCSFYMHLHQAGSSVSTPPEHSLWCWWEQGGDPHRLQLQSRLAGRGWSFLSVVPSLGLEEPYTYAGPTCESYWEMEHGLGGKSHRRL